MKMVTYHFDSVADMAELFAENARKIRDRLKDTTPQNKRVMQAEAHVWEQAASYVRGAKIGKPLPAGAVITPLSYLGADSPMHPAHEEWLKSQKP
jgi:hypothetical protein